MNIAITDSELLELETCSDVTSISTISADSFGGETINLCGTPEDCLMDYFKPMTQQLYPLADLNKFEQMPVSVPKKERKDSYRIDSTDDPLLLVEKSFKSVEAAFMECASPYFPLQREERK
jgi:hypothetical protein